MRAKATIRAELSNNKKELEDAFLAAVRTAFPENPPPGLNTIAITSAVPQQLKEKDAQAIVNYFQPRYQQLVILGKMLEKTPDISKNFEEGVSQQSEQVALQEILESIRRNTQEFSAQNSTGYEQTLNSYEKDLAKMQQQNAQINAAIKNVDSLKGEEKAEYLQKIAVDLADLMRQLEQIEQKMAAITVAIDNSAFSYNSPKGVDRRTIQSYVQRQPLQAFQKELQNFANITVPTEIPKILAADNIAIDALSIQVDLAINETIGDLSERYQFYQDFNQQYHDAIDVLENINNVNDKAQALEQDIKKFRNEIIQTETVFKEKKAKNDQYLLIQNIRQEFRNITREKITLLRNDANKIATITYSKDKNSAIDLAIKSVDELIGRYQSLHNKVQENITENEFPEYLNGIADHLADLKTYKASVEQVKREYEKEIEEIQKKHLSEPTAGKSEVDQSRAAEKSTAKLAKDIKDLQQKVLIANEYLYFLKGKQPPVIPKIPTKPLKIIELPFSAITELIDDINNNLITINNDYNILEKTTKNLAAALPKLAESVTAIRDNVSDLQENYRKTIAEFIKEFEDKYSKLLEAYPGKTAFLQQDFDVKLDAFKKTLLVIGPKSEFKISPEDRQTYITKINEHLQSRDSFTTRFFRDPRLTQQKDIIGKVGVKLINKLDSPAQLESLLNVLLSWNEVAENLSGKKYRLGMSSGLAKVFKEILTDLQAKQSAQIQQTPGKSS